MSTPLSGVTIDLSGIGAYIKDAVGIFLPVFLIPAGLAVAAWLLSRGLAWLRAQGARKA